MDLSKREKEYRSTRCVCGQAFKYSYFTVYPKDAALIVKMKCPFCQKDLAVDLSPYTRNEIYSYRSEGKSIQHTDILVADLPEELSGQERKE
mgnify:CR=1 FL=1|jgi:hypothetical protein